MSDSSEEGTAEYAMRPAAALMLTTTMLELVARSILTTGPLTDGEI